MELDDIAKRCADEIADPYDVRLSDADIIRSAIDKAIEFVLTREPSDKVFDVGFKALERQYSEEQFDDYIEKVFHIYRAMQAALLEELKGKTWATRPLPNCNLGERQMIRLGEFKPTHRYKGVEYEVLDYLRVKIEDSRWVGGVLYRNKDNTLCVRTYDNFKIRFTPL